MKILAAINKTLLLGAFVLTALTTYGQTASNKTADKWLKSMVWAKGLKIKVYSDVNSVDFMRQYNAAKPTWDKVFEFLADSKKLDSLHAGMYPIDGKNAYASITIAPSKTPEAAKWESHRKYIDLQYVISGEEKIGVAPLSAATVTDPYNESKDAAHYTAEGKYYIATPAEFYLFFPSEAHRPNLKVEGYDTVKKLVIKIRYVE